MFSRGSELCNVTWVISSKSGLDARDLLGLLIAVWLLQVFAFFDCRGTKAIRRQERIALIAKCAIETGKHVNPDAEDLAASIEFQESMRVNRLGANHQVGHVVAGT